MGLITPFLVPAVLVGAAPPTTLLVGASGGAAAPAFLPSSLYTGGYQGAWYDPSDLTSMWQESTGTTPAVVGQPVGKMLDKSGNANHLLQATAADRPTLQQDGSGKYYLLGDGTTDFMGVAATIAGADVYCAAGIRSVATGATNNRIFALPASAGTADFNAWTYEAGLLREAGSNYGSFRNSLERAYVALADNTLGIIETGSTATGSLAALNGGADTTTAFTAGGNFSIGYLSILGPQGAFASERFYGGLVINRIPTAGERANVVTYLNGKTGAF